MPNLEGQVAIVTGGTRGIGWAIAKTLGEAGATVVITGRDARRTAEKAAELARITGAKVEGIAGDVAHEAECAQLIQQTVERFERLDILVNNAGITRDTLIARMKPDDWQAVIDTNLSAVFHTSRAAARLMMRQRSGRILNITSIVGITGNAGQCNYAAAKAGIIGFSKSLAKEIGSRGVTVNCVAPGFIETDMTAKLDEKTKNGLLGQIPLNRLGTAEDVAQAVLFLCSPGADYITGAVLQVDGGLAM